ncbi:hypothetical protein [Marinobacter persicus]|uniref:hypothetical protein n=1 Tax=Marinobacter persicus TaxID=930118 RepID=UPI000B803969|nr:hypothetical protein [Marinobacter persicus]
MYLFKKFSISVAAILAVSAYCSPLASQERDVDKLIDPQVEVIEGFILDFLADDETILGVVLEQCNNCSPSTLLAAPGIKVTGASGSHIDESSLQDFEGKFGVVHVDKESGMVFRVSFLGDR